MTDLPSMIRSPNFVTDLRALATRDLAIDSATDAHGVTVLWCELANSEDLVPLATLFRNQKARLVMVTASQPPKPDEEEEDEEEDEETEGEEENETAPPAPALTFGGTSMDGTSYEIIYHFAVQGDIVNLIVHVPQSGSLPSLTPLFRTADWPEREIMELYGMVFSGHPNPRRLFLDKSIDPAVLERLIPFSTLANAASTQELWSKVTAAAKAGES
ncbi:MAG: NADH-quinone oxidoreductase subunit C [Rhodospirillum sp.]|nr:NADH-quinone oxidoreductase subunit C [Rhodospirillum sp.]MCF8489222.1 NADH-quinone oxidoreductase subunit C [Rhodospirillum sp.]MCF8502678.1 NADH-quinone oxidoreductase subunit C [Rhodospirillum sp.]